MNHADHELDITRDTCPMTFVRARLQLDRMRSGQVLALRFRGEEPRRNLPRTLAEQGHEVLEAGEELILVRKG
ncbi:sulfurtransferase TusA family protein [Roseococcus sp. DSY-14]|uniref:sulfurtransferase TusA family protein n=1 Tax=Roseococcus sp. DSY-14 TaxID=3369650 RepID=UPI00387B7678